MKAFLERSEVMPKVDLEMVKVVVERNVSDVRTRAQIMEDLQFALQNEEDKKGPAVRKQFAILGSDPEGKLKGMNLTGWVLQLAEEDNPKEAEERLTRAAAEFNASPKGRKEPVGTIGEFCEVAPARLLKEHGIWLKTKSPVEILGVRNQLPIDRTRRKAAREVE